MKLATVAGLFILGLARKAAAQCPPCAESWQVPDRNCYCALYECKAGNPRCDVDIATLSARACDVVVRAADPNWSAIADNAGARVYCVEAGDHLAKGVLALTHSGSSGAPKILRYYRAGDALEDPWRQTDGTRAKILGLRIAGSHWIAHRLTLPSNDGPSPRIESDGGASDHVFDRILIDGGGEGELYYGYSQNCRNFGGYRNLTVQNSVFRNVGPGLPSDETIAVDLQCGGDLRSVNNEIYDWVSHAIQLGNNELPTVPGVVVENNDLYVTPARHTYGGQMSISESVLSVKIASTANAYTRVVQNRMGGTRFTDDDRCCNADSGQIVGNYMPNSYALYKDNIIFDGQIGIDNVASNVSFVGNIFWKIRRYASYRDSLAINAWVSHPGGANGYEIYLNTFVDNEQYNVAGLNEGDVDARCNVFIGAGSKYPGSPPANSQGDRNAFFDSEAWSFNGTGSNIDRPIATRAASSAYTEGTLVRTGPASACSGPAAPECMLYMAASSGTTAAGSTSPCTTLGCTFTDGSVSWRAVRGPYCFYRKLRTGPEQVCIPYTAVHPSAPESSLCRGVALGARPGIGVNDEVAAW